jgi:hypothetical protein
MRAVENGHVGVVTLLLDAAKQRDKPIAKRRNMKGETALHKAAVTGMQLYISITTPLSVLSVLSHSHMCILPADMGWVYPLGKGMWRWRDCWWRRAGAVWR